MKKYIILLPPPCTNATLHMGHLAGVYLPADIYGRYQNLMGNRTVLIGGADQNNTYTYKKSIQCGKSFNNTQQHFTKLIYKALLSANINCNFFIETSSQLHKSTVKNIISILMENNFLEIRNINQLYCPSCEKYVVDSLVYGICDTCHVESDAGICENCSSPIFNNKLTNGIHIECSHPTELKLAKVLVLKLNLIKDNLVKLISESKWDDRLKTKYLYYLKNAQENITLTYDFIAGIEVNNLGLDAKKITIWFEALWIIFTALNNANLNSVINLLNDENTVIVPFMGQDTEFYYALGLSAVLLGLGVNKILHSLSVQRFIKLDDQKFSSSRNHIITIDQLKEKYPIDFIRFYSIYILQPYEKDNNNFNLIELNDLYINFSSKIEKLFSYSTSWKKHKFDLFFSQDTINILNNYHYSMENLKFYEVAKQVEELLNLIMKNIENKSLNNEVPAFIFMLKPIMPELAEKLVRDFYGKKSLPANMHKFISNSLSLCPRELSTYKELATPYKY